MRKYLGKAEPRFEPRAAWCKAKTLSIVLGYSGAADKNQIHAQLREHVRHAVGWQTLSKSAGSVESFDCVSDSLLVAATKRSLRVLDT